ncbi:hypothetical protein [Paractinoplanes lichenicola]|uniref:Uncharacterized protein n=1 Tax=Paractinoplanes lichenicola TaxID=2802976 RepID=A0ABS1VH45_9ACTN|nr:hypothetical protein [Actinoplanes lichenicola]MBL7254036.1 hypothetical protein [Actinoplanes lichenicola]
MSFTDRMAYALEKDFSDDERHTKVGLRCTAILVGWAVIVPILIGYAVTGRQRETEVISIAASLTLLMPFTAAVVATHGRRFGLGAAYVVLTLLMVLPAVWVAQLG